MKQERCIVVGGGHAAAQIVASLRQEGWGGEIVLISDEIYLPYNRPTLSKQALLNNDCELPQSIRSSEFYDKQKIKLVLGKTVTKIDRERKQVLLSSGEVESYTKLALLTGARARKLTIPGSDKKGVYYLRTFDDVKAIVRAAQKGASVVLIGGGYIGLEAAASFRKLGLTVTIVEGQERILSRVTSPALSRFYTRVHQEEGVEIIVNASPVSIDGKSRVEAITLSNGMSLKADFIVAGIGVISSDELAKAAGLEVDNGVIVNEFSITSDPDIVAAGDCARHYNPIFDRSIRLESVQNAVEQSKIAAKAICGERKKYISLPWFWSDQYDLKLQMAGISAGYDDIRIRGNAVSGRSFSAFYFRDEKLISVDAVNRPLDFACSKKAILEKITIDKDAISDESIDIKKLLA